MHKKRLGTTGVSIAKSHLKNYMVCWLWLVCYWISLKSNYHFQWRFWLCETNIHYIPTG